MADSRKDRLEEAWGLGIQGYYDPALEILEDLLRKESEHLGALRLQGNLLELKAMDLREHSAKKLMSSADYLAARRCHERILEVDPRNVKARIDLGDHYRNLDAIDRALTYYKDVASILQQTSRGTTWEEDVRELLKAVALMMEHDRVAQEAGLIASWCKEALDGPESTAG